MIKTMLLTAQLALSPIVGTNGLQPKRLPNPVYGDTTDYSVTYNGEKWTRIGYQNSFAKTLEREDIILGCRNWEKPYELSINPSYSVSESNFPTYYPYQFYVEFIEDDSIAYYNAVHWDDQTTEMQMPNICFSYWQESEDQLDYFEVFCANGNIDTCIITEWVGNQTNWSFSDQWEAEPYLIFGMELYTKDKGYDLGSWYRTIPAEQPTTANPSVYDNIYNFYYQNLFANEALDELGAEVGNNSLTMRQWLAHTATIVSISLLACALVILVIKIFKLIAGSISDIWG